MGSLQWWCAMTIGRVGSTHDNRVFTNSDLFRNRAAYFTEEEYLIADSGYACSKIVVPAYKSPATNHKENSDFNTYLSAARVVNEHNIGILKGRFQCLRSLRIIIRDKKSYTRATLWFLVCCVRHNVLEDMKEYFDDGWDQVETAQTKDCSSTEVLELGIMDEGKQRRETVKETVLILCKRGF